MSCRVCGGDGFGWLRRQAIPVLLNVVHPSRAQAIAAPRGDLDLWVCQRCGFVSNRAFDPARMHYDADYENRQDCSARFEQHLRDRIDRLLEHGLREATVVEVGCGQGDFLVRLCDAGQNRGVGFDPAYRGVLEPEGPVRFVRGSYSGEASGIDADAVVCRHVIEHIPDPLVLLRSIRAAVSTGTRVFFETPDLGWIAERQVSWDLFYEHCSYFTAVSLDVALRRAGFQPDRIETVFEGQYLWAEATAREPTEAHGSRLTDALTQQLTAFRDAEQAHASADQQRVDALRTEGAVAAWGAGAKGVTWLNLVDPHAERIDCVVDINPAKQGGFVPGTGHPIVSVEDLGPRGVRNAVVMNPNYLEENRRRIAECGLSVRLHDPR